MLAVLAAGAALAAPETVIGGQLGLLAWQRAGDHGALVAPGFVLARRGRWLGGTFELDGAVAQERNEGVLAVTWPLRASATVDLVVRRRDAAWATGVGPGVSVLVSSIRTDAERWSGVTVRPVLRARTSLDAPISGAVRWRVGTGIGARPAGVDWDVGVGVVVAL